MASPLFPTLHNIPLRSSSDFVVPQYLHFYRGLYGKGNKHCRIDRRYGKGVTETWVSTDPSQGIPAYMEAIQKLFSGTWRVEVFGGIRCGISEGNIRMAERIRKQHDVHAECGTGDRQSRGNKPCKYPSPRLFHRHQ